MTTKIDAFKVDLEEQSRLQEEADRKLDRLANLTSNYQSAQLNQTVPEDEEDQPEKEISTIKVVVRVRPLL